MNLSIENKQTHGHGEQTVVVKGEGEGVGGTGSLGLADANYCIFKWISNEILCIAYETISSHL